MDLSDEGARGAGPCRRYPGTADVCRDSTGNRWLESADTHVHIDGRLLQEPASRRLIEQAYILKEVCQASQPGIRASHAVRRESPLPGHETPTAVVLTRRAIDADHQALQRWARKG